MTPNKQFQRTVPPRHPVQRLSAELVLYGSRVLGIHDYWLFVVTGVLLNLTPGQDTFYILARSVAEGMREGVASALGITVGSLLHTAMAALGLLRSSPRRRRRLPS